MRFKSLYKHVAIGIWGTGCPGRILVAWPTFARARAAAGARTFSTANNFANEINQVKTYESETPKLDEVQGVPSTEDKRAPGDEQYLPRCGCAPYRNPVAGYVSRKSKPARNQFPI